MSKTGKIAAAVAFAAACFIAGRRSVDENPAAGRRILYYHDPMHPAYKSDKPGIAPDCGMELEPVYGEGKPAETVSPARSGAVVVDSEQQKRIGVRLEDVAEQPATPTVRVLGRVAADETRIVRLASAVDGWVRKTGAVVTGGSVRKDDLLATFYNRDFLTAQQTYLYALNTWDRFKENESAEQLKLTGAQIRAAEENLEFLGMAERQVKEIARTRQVAKEIELRAPVSGIVLVRNAYPGLRYERGAELFRIANLDRVWVLADLFENESRLLAAARHVTVRYQGRGFPARLSEAPLQFDPASRTLKVRLELDNPGSVLRPDMFVDVEVRLRLPASVTAPADAIIDSGRRKTVFVDRGKGVFEPRLVETGWRIGDRVQITKGLEPGERIVVSGNFLIDSESRMKLLAASAGQPADKDPVCWMSVDARAPNVISAVRDGKTYYFCSDHCRKTFEAHPGKLAKETKGERGPA